MKAIILAGGTGSRLYPLTQIVNKQLLAVYDKPMIYYPLTALIAAGIKEFCLISDPNNIADFKKLLGNGSQWGINIHFREQCRPEGIAQAFLIAEDFIGNSPVVLMLGDNIFSGGNDLPKEINTFTEGATIFGYHVKDPERYAVVEFDSFGDILSLEEKPTNPKSNFAVPGVYIYDHTAINITKNLKPSKRGELEITDLNIEYLKNGRLKVCRLSRGFAWLDAGTSSDLQEASAYIEAIEKRQGIKIGCPEEASLIRGFLSIKKFKKNLLSMPECQYKRYLERIAREIKIHDSKDTV